MYTHTYLSVYVYIYIYIEREREIHTYMYTGDRTGHPHPRSKNVLMPISSNLDVVNIKKWRWGCSVWSQVWLSSDMIVTSK